MLLVVDLEATCDNSRNLGFLRDTYSSGLEPVVPLQVRYVWMEEVSVRLRHSRTSILGRTSFEDVGGHSWHDFHMENVDVGSVRDRMNRREIGLVVAGGERMPARGESVLTLVAMLAVVGMGARLHTTAEICLHFELLHWSTLQDSGYMH